MNKYTIEGFNDIHFEELRGYDIITTTIESLMRTYGYKQVLTPTFESYDMYDIDGAFPRQKMFKLIDNDGRVLVLRPDATIPITRMAATGFKKNNELLKFGYITSIFRHISCTTDFRKEFMQAGVEYLGSNLPDCDAEIISLAINILLNLKINEIHIDIGEVSYLNSLFDEINVDAPTKIRILNYIENKNIGELKDFLTSLHVPEKLSEILCEIPMLFGKFQETISKAKKMCINESMHKAVDHMEKTYEIIKNYGYENYIYVDLGFTNQFNYYSGLIFKGYINGIGESILSGGRYDNLSSTFGVNRPASGFGINISLLMDVLNNSFEAKPYFDLLLLYEDNSTGNAIKLSKDLRLLGITTDCMHSCFLDSIKKDTYKNIVRIIDNQLYIENGKEQESITLDRLHQLLKGENR